MLTDPVTAISQHLKFRREKKIPPSYHHRHFSSEPRRPRQTPRRIHPPIVTHHVSRSLPGPLHGHPERLQRQRRRIHHRHGCRQPLRRVHLRRVLRASASEARRPDSLQGLRTPCAVQGADEAVSCSTVLSGFLPIFPETSTDFSFQMYSMVQFEAR